MSGKAGNTLSQTGPTPTKEATMQNGWTERIEELEAEKQRLMDEIRDLEWKIYRPLKEGEMTRDGDQVLGPEEDAKWEPVAGNYRPAPSPLYPAHCQYRRPIVDELRKEMEGDYFYRKCVAGKESARSKRIKELEAENKRLRELVDGAKEIVEIANCTSPARRKRKGGRRMASSYSPYTTKCDACGEIIRDDEKNVGYECDLHERCAHE